jgi:hypothetical protein
MPELINLIWTVFVIFLAFVISSLPLYFAVKWLRGRTTLLKTVAITLLTGIIASLIHVIFKSYSSLIAFIVLVWIYHEVFRLKWLKAVLAWLLQFAFIILFSWILLFILSASGISLVALL